MNPQQAKDWLFGFGLRNFMSTYEWKETKCRNLIAKWMHANGPQLAAQAVDSIIRHRPMEPASWAMAFFKTANDAVAEKHRPGHRPQANLPPDLKPHERADPDRVANIMAAFRREMEETE